MGGQPKSEASSLSSAEVRRLWEEPTEAIPQNQREAAEILFLLTNARSSLEARMLALQPLAAMPQTGNPQLGLRNSKCLIRCRLHPEHLKSPPSVGQLLSNLFEQKKGGGECSTEVGQTSQNNLLTADHRRTLLSMI